MYECAAPFYTSSLDPQDSTNHGLFYRLPKRREESPLKNAQVYLKNKSPAPFLITRVLST